MAMACDAGAVYCQCKLSG